MKRTRFTRLIPAAILALNHGCLTNPFVKAPAPPPRNAEVASAAATLFNATPADKTGVQPLAGLRVSLLAMDVARVALPLDDVRDAPKVWNHVDELRLGPDLGVRLARNGLRIGVGSPQAWPAIRAILDTSRCEVSQERVVAEMNQPLTLKLGMTSEGESVFAYLGNNQLTGKSFPVAEKLLSLDYQVRAELGGRVDLRMLFEVRQDLGVMAWERSNGVIREVPAYNRHVFEGLAPFVSLTPGEFLAIGLGPSIEKPYSIGNRFLTSERDGRTVEVLLFLTPHVLQRQPAP